MGSEREAHTGEKGWEGLLWNVGRGGDSIGMCLNTGRGDGSNVS